MKKPTVKVCKNKTVYKNEKGQFHREDGPAVEYAGGDKQWWVDGQLNRTDGPAVENSNGCKEWWVKGRLHRTDGPAIEFANGRKSWYIEGEPLSESEFNRRTKQTSYEGKVVEIDGVKYKLVKL